MHHARHSIIEEGNVVIKLEYPGVVGHRMHRSVKWVLHLKGERESGCSSLTW